MAVDALCRFGRSVLSPSSDMIHLDGSEEWVCVDGEAARGYIGVDVFEGGRMAANCCPVWEVCSRGDRAVSGELERLIMFPSICCKASSGDLADVR